MVFLRAGGHGVHVEEDEQQSRKLFKRRLRQRKATSVRRVKEERHIVESLSKAAEM